MAVARFYTHASTHTLLVSLPGCLSHQAIARTLRLDWRPPQLPLILFPSSPLILFSPQLPLILFPLRDRSRRIINEAALVASDLPVARASRA